jgi:two-component system, OmpR family, response regulator CpxR
MIMPDLLSSLRILLVDDEVEPLQLCAQVIKMCGFRVVTANSPMDAIYIMTEKPVGRIDLAMLDYNMPIMNGCVLAERLKSMWPEMKIIPHSGEVDIPQNEMTSIDTFIPKGDIVGQLLAQIIRLAQIRMLPPATVESTSAAEN